MATLLKSLHMLKEFHFSLIFKEEVSGMYRAFYLGKLNIMMLVWFFVQANIQYCPSCHQKYCSIEKWSKSTQKYSSRFVNLNP
jgi:hypothetical protein